MKNAIVRKGIVFALLMGAFAALAVSAQDVSQETYDENSIGEAAASPAPESRKAAAAPGNIAVPAVQKTPASNFEWSGWGRVVWAPLIMQGGYIFDETGLPQSDSQGIPEYENNAWVGSGPGEEDIGAIIGVRVKGQNPAGTVGMDLQLGIDVGSLTSHNVVFAKDNVANAWAKPFGNEWLTVRGGLFLVDDLYGKIGGVNENFGFPGSKGGGEDDIFDRINSGGRFGFHIKSAPLDGLQFDGLQLHAAFGVNDSAAKNYNSADRADAWKEVFSAAQYGIGYDIGKKKNQPDGKIGLVRFQYIGGSYGKSSLASFLGASKRWDQVQFAFQLKAVKDLKLDLGMKIPLKIEGDSLLSVNHLVEIKDLNPNQMLLDNDWYQPPITARIAGRYNFGALGLPGLGLHLGLKFGFSEKIEYTRATEISWERPYTFGLDFEPSYTIGNIGKVVGNFAVAVKAKSTTTDAGVSTDNIDDTTDIGVGVSFHRSFGNGNFSIGFYSNFPVGGEGYSDIANGLAKAQAFKLAIPITITYDL